MATSSPAWSAILQDILKSPTERQRLAAALDITQMTLSRWANGDSKPQKNHLIQLIHAIHPAQRTELIHALEAIYSDIHTWLKEDTSGQLPPDFYANILHLRTAVNEQFGFWHFREIVARQALQLLDPDKLGMAIRLVLLMPPSPHYGNLIVSMRETTGKGTPPWHVDLEQDVTFLGMESLCGLAVGERRTISNGDLRLPHAEPYFRDKHEFSAAAHPICLEGRVAGCLLASSTQINHFMQQRLNLLAALSDLMALAFHPQEFYPHAKIMLRRLPPPSDQRKILATFRHRMMAKYQGSLTPRNNTQKELAAWCEIETELLALLPNN